MTESTALPYPLTLCDESMQPLFKQINTCSDIYTDCIIQLYEKALEYILWILPISGEAMNEMTF